MSERRPTLCRSTGGQAGSNYTDSKRGVTLYKKFSRKNILKEKLMGWIFFSHKIKEKMNIIASLSNSGN